MMTISLSSHLHCTVKCLGKACSHFNISVVEKIYIFSLVVLSNFYILVTCTSLISDIIFLYQLAQARPHNVLYFLVSVKS